MKYLSEFPSTRYPMDLATKQYLIASGVFALGLSGWLLPFRWNILKLRHPYNKYFSERGNMIFAKSFGSVLIFVGAVMIAVTIGGGDFISRP
jgi:hypothetical protein